MSGHGCESMSTIVGFLSCCFINFLTKKNLHSSGDLILFAFLSYFFILFSSFRGHFYFRRHKSITTVTMKAVYVSGDFVRYSWRR